MAVHLAMVKYGQENIKVETLFEHVDRTILADMEMHFIEHHSTRAPHGYNLTSGGDGAPNLSSEAEQRRCSGISKSLTGKKLTAEHRANLSSSHKGIPSPRKGKKASAETKKRQSEAAKRRWARDRAEIIRQRDTDEYRSALSEGVTKSWQRRR